MNRNERLKVMFKSLDNHRALAGCAEVMILETAGFVQEKEGWRRKSDGELFFRFDALSNIRKGLES